MKATILSNIGLCYFVRRRFDEAGPYFERAISLLRQDVQFNRADTILANYAALLRKTGRKQAAKQFDLRAKEAAAHFPDAGQRRTVDAGELNSFKK